MEPLVRSSYTTEDGTIIDVDTTYVESRRDQEDYFQPLHRAHGASLHTWGVAEGLTVSAVKGEKKVRVSVGMALDADGRSIILASGDPAAAVGGQSDSVTPGRIVKVEGTGIDLSTENIGAGGDYAVTVQFWQHYNDTDPNLPLWLETPWLRLWPLATPPPDNGRVIFLAQVTLDNQGKVTDLKDGGNRRLAGLPAGSLTLRRPSSGANPLSVGQTDAVELRPRADGGLEISTTQPGSPPTLVPRLSIDGATGAVGIGTAQHPASLDVAGSLRIGGDTVLRGNLTVNANIGVTGTVDDRDVSADGSKLDTHVADTSNPHGMATQLAKYLLLTGGPLSGNLTVNANIGVTGTVDGRDVSADGSKLDTHVADTSNPHGMATRLADYLPLTGGALSGNLTVNANIGVSGNASIGQQLTIGGSLIVGGTDFVLRGRGGGAGNNNKAGRALVDLGPAEGLAVNYANDFGKVTISGDVGIGGNLGFGSTTRQMINLWGTQYGIGVQGWTQYYRTGTDFAWFKGGAHHDGRQNPGGGVRLMALNEAGDLILSARTNPAADTKKSMCRALVDLGPNGGLSVNHDNDFGQVVIGGNVGIGIPKPEKKLHVLANIQDHSALLENSHAQGYGLIVAAANDPLRIGPKGDYTGRFLIVNSLGNVGIGTKAPQAKLHVEGDIMLVEGAGHQQVYIGGDDSTDHALIGSKKAGVGELAVWNWADGYWMDIRYRNAHSHSDLRSKTNIVQLTDALERLGRMRGVSFEWKVPIGRPTGERNIGFIGQELETVVPDLVRKRGDEGHRFIDYNGVTAVIVEAVKELIGRTEALNHRMKELERRSA